MQTQDRLREIIISITNRCNLRCAMCEIPDKGSGPEMTTQEVKAIIDDAESLFPGSIVFSGGEPLLREDIFELISYANAKKFNTCLTSNGLLIDDAVAAKLAACGMGVVNISIEGPAEVHDSLRGTGNFKKALDALGHLARHKIESTIATVVCRQNYRHLLYVMELAHQAGVTTVKFQPFSTLFLTDKARGRDFFMAPDLKTDLEGVIEEVIAFGEAHKIATNPVNYLRALPAYLCGRGPTMPPAHCAALWASCPISAEGDVYPCWVFSGKVVGNVKKTRLSKIWDSQRHRQLRRRILEKDCSGCFMSCYDSNLGKYGLAELFALKAGKLKKPRFYKRSWFRLYQYVRYMSRKIMRRLSGLGPRRSRGATDDQGFPWQAVRDAKDKLRQQYKKLKDA